MKYAKTCFGRKICVIISKEGIKVYGNRQAFKYLAGWLNQLAKSPKNAYHECHAALDLQTSSSLFGDGPKNIWFLFDATTFPLFKKKIRNKDFEFTFMVVEEKDLETMKRYQNSGKVPTKIRKNPDSFRTHRCKPGCG